MNLQTLIANLTLDDEADRSDAAEDLGYAGVAEAIAPLMERLASEPSRKVRETIFHALERLDLPEVRIRMGMLLDSDDAFLRNQAIGMLQRKGAASVPVLFARMNDPDPDVRKFVLDTAAGISSPDVEPIYEAAMRDLDVNVLIAALEHVGEHRMRRFKRAVEETFLKAQEPMLVSAAFSALLQIGDAGSWQTIRQRYPTAAIVPDWELNWWIRALGEFGASAEIEEFRNFLTHHNDKDAASEIIHALARFQDRHGRMAVSEEIWRALRKVSLTELPSEVKAQLLRVLEGFDAPPALADKEL